MFPISFFPAEIRTSLIKVPVIVKRLVAPDIPLSIGMEPLSTFTNFSIIVMNPNRCALSVYRL